MALRIWLPLNGNLENKGISGVEATASGAPVVDNNGKIGKCYKIGTAGSGITLPASAMTSFTECSLAFWIKINSWNTSYATYFQAGLNSNPWVHYIFGILRNNANSNLCFTISNGSSASNASYTTSNLELNTWYHLTFTYTTGKCTIYINGEFYKEYTTSIVPNFASITNISIGRGTNNSSYQTDCYLNDLRIYDHCLSALEVKEISQGLVLHYKLNDNFMSSNGLLLNGDGSLGTSYWSNGTVMSSSDLPTGSNARVNFKGGSYTELIPVVSDHSYTVSAFAKTAGAATGNWYPSIYPYDADKNFISHMMTPDGFRASTITTLARDLNPGDTVIYATNLSSWNTGSGHYGNYCAIFGYQDSTGYTYPDLVYTRTIPAFGSGTNAKTNINQSNNTITLNSAYSGRVCPAGTTICQSSNGSTYYYPWGNVTLASIQDWTFKTAIIVPKDINRLKAAKYFGWSNYSDAGLLADIKIIDDTFSGSENLIVSLLSGGQTSVSGLKVTTSGINGDTYFRANLKRPLKAGEVYTISCVASGINDGEYFSFPIGSQNNSSIAFVIKNGYNEYTFIANSVCETNPLMFDDNHRPSTPTVCTIDKLHLKKASKIKDSSGYENDGIIYGTLKTDINTAKYENSIYFDGNTASIKVPFNDMIKDKNYTVSVWTYKTVIGTKNYQTILGGPSGFELEARSSSNESPLYRLHNWGGGTTAYEFNKWNHFCFVHNDTNCKLYVNGELKITGSSVSVPVGDYFIGSWKVYNSQNYDGWMSDFRIYATALSEEDILDLYHTPASIDNLGGLHGFELEDKKQNILFPTCHVLTTKDWNASTLLKNYTQSNCQVTLTDDGLRIYRPANYNPTNNGSTMWGGMRLANTSDGGKHVYNNNDNPMGLQKGHTYIIYFKVKGKSSNANSNYGWTNQMGWGGGGLSPSPSNIEYDLIPANFNGEKICWYKWTINDDIVKTCTTSYSYATQGNQYMSYADFAFGWGYQDTGAMGTDIYITDIQMYDITDDSKQSILKNGIIQITTFWQENINDNLHFLKGGLINTNNIVEK